MDRVLGTLKKHSCNRGYCACEDELPAWLRGVRNPCERGDCVQIQDVDMWVSRVGSSGRGLNNIQQVSQVPLPLLRRHLVSFLWSTCELIPAVCWNDSEVNNSIT